MKSTNPNFNLLNSNGPEFFRPIYKADMKRVFKARIFITALLALACIVLLLMLVGGCGGGGGGAVASAPTAQETPAIQDMTTLQDTSVVQDVLVAQDTSTQQDTSVVQDTAAVEDVSVAQNDTAVDQTTQDTGVVTGTLDDTDVTSAARTSARAANCTVSGAKVYAYPESVPAAQRKPDAKRPYAVTDAKGYFEIKNAPIGRCVLVVDYDSDGESDGTLPDVVVEKHKCTDLGTKHFTPVDKPKPDVPPTPAVTPQPPADTHHKVFPPKPEPTKKSYCDVKLNKVNYATGETLVMAITGYNAKNAAVKCGVIVVQEKGRNHPVMWKSDFANALLYVMLPAGANGSGVINKVIPAEWVQTNSRNGSDYKVYTIREDGSLWGGKDNFNILKECKHKYKKDRCDDDDVTPPPVDPPVVEPPVTPPPVEPPVDPPVVDPPAPPCSIACTADSQCDDANQYTADYCVSPGTCDAYCLNADGI